MWTWLMNKKILQRSSQNWGLNENQLQSSLPSSSNIELSSLLINCICFKSLWNIVWTLSFIFLTWLTNKKHQTTEKWAMIKKETWLLKFKWLVASVYKKHDRKLHSIFTQPLENPHDGFFRHIQCFFCRTNINSYNYS